MAGMREEMDNMEPYGAYFLEARKKGAFCHSVSDYKEVRDV